MLLQQVFVACCYLSINLHQITAVVNNGQNSLYDINSNITIVASTNATNDNSLSDSVAESTDFGTHKDAFLSLSNTYGAPPLLQDSYAPLVSGNVAVPAPVYGVPDVITNTVVHPASTPDILPPISSTFFVPPKAAFSFPPAKYGPPRPFKTFYHSSPVYGHPKSQYGPPSKPLFVPRLPKPGYGPPFKSPKPFYGLPKPLFTSAKPFNTYGPPVGPPKVIYGQPNIKYEAPQYHYGPPDPVPHGPPHPGIPAPPTPPDIRYDGWQPIIGLVSKIPHPDHDNVHGVHIQNGDVNFNEDLAPPSDSHSSGYKGDSYNAPLNTVTGSGGVVLSSGKEHAQFGDSLNQNINNDALSLVKSIDFELSSNSAGVPWQDSHISGPASFASHSAGEAHAAPYSYSTLQSIDNFASPLAPPLDTAFLSSGLAPGLPLIPPSGVYGLPPGGKYGTPLLAPPLKNPVSFRDSVPLGLIHNIGNFVLQKDTNSIDSVFLKDFGGAPYVPPAVPDAFDATKDGHVALTTLHSLPVENPGVPFNNYGINGNFATLRYNSVNSFTTPLSPVGVPPAHLIGPAHAGYLNTYQTIGHDCSHYSQPLNSLAFAVPAATSYTTLHNNIGGLYNAPPPPLGFAPHDDLNTAYSQSSASVTSNNLEEVKGKSTEKEIDSNGKLTNLEGIDLNNIPLKGALGSYTLQIQSSDGSTPSVSHEHVLKDGLLHSILGAIEQPDAQTNGQSSSLHLQQVAQEHAGQDSIPQNSISHNVVAASTDPKSKTAESQRVDSNREKKLVLLDNNEIALYFTNTDFNKHEGNNLYPYNSAVQDGLRNLTLNR